MRKQCRRKIWTKINTLEYVMQGIKPVDDGRLSGLRTLELSSLEAFRTGVATEQDWQHLADMLNVAEQMAKSGVGVEVIEVCADAQKYLSTAAKRYRKTGRMLFTGPELQCIRDLYEYHDLQRKSVTLAEYEKHIRKVQNKIRGKSPQVVCADTVVL